MLQKAVKAAHLIAKDKSGGTLEWVCLNQLSTVHDLHANDFTLYNTPM